MSGDATKRPVPKSYKGWLKEMTGVQHFLTNLPATVDDCGTKWKNNTIKYYTARLAHLQQNRPKTPDRK
jgi:hypothetical protein